ncbi:MULTISPECIES: heme utilization cystosolic carrier protein HutX [Paracoccus]|uniref:Heme utilization protein HuvX n=1 Tax=Paracoccus versutus TaxID=34007 RepID=A0A3D9XN60_PARVE|nr:MULTISPECIES: heme utilization cystosolic carrier protein HutX [Paracoccus]MDF3855683.1 heme utilization cystosolic carrier protein HutX [Paracoccus pantotrophus]MDK8873363.1 heme utilization cystosolic carrier protein HutX [Paracoccus sp. SSJ]REF68329.1 heme utilization protein HuvX [Paracoccus versutus]WGR58989.1 heme utilization cystosolic carrier protein HutX [Paracoccus versutus]SFO78590.1 heme utilization protein HuvX [Paracoccus pantotrophus]
MADLTVDPIRAALAETPHAALEDIARKAATTPLAVLDALPEGEVVSLPGTTLPEVLKDIARWGEITLIVHTPTVILEVKAPLGHSEIGNGMLNLHGKPIGGHIKYEACARVAFVRRKLFGIETRSVQFYAKDGLCMFKIYLGRDEGRQLKAEQISAFDALEARLISA